jgi:alpha-aminoadipic semialdehyde synthase
MSRWIGIRREDKSEWERRVPIVPQDARQLQAEHGIAVWVQPSKTRIFPDVAYERAGTRVEEDISPCPIVLAVKEMPVELFTTGCTYLFFAHVIKGQPHNMPMLQALLDKGCQLIDYERLTDRQGRKMVLSSRHAGLAGMIDSLWALGRRLDWEGIRNPFSELRQAYQYEGLAQAMGAVSRLGGYITEEGLPDPIAPLICGFAGYGNVFRGANEIIELLPVQEIRPDQVADVAQNSEARDVIYKVVFKEEHAVEPIDPGHTFQLQDYYDHPEKYRSRFHTYLPHLVLLINCVYWEERYPRLVTKRDVGELYSAGRQPRLRVIGDISCDLEGAIEVTVESTDPGDPVYVYDPFENRISYGVGGDGPVVLAVEILPSELAREASAYFSSSMMDYLPIIASADYSVPFEELDLPPGVKRAVIVHRGQLTPDYRYLANYLR